MALTILNEPAGTDSINNEMIFVIFEATKAIDPDTYPDYRYVLDLYVDSILIQRQKARPRPDNNYGVFDVSPALREYVSYGLDASANIIDYVAKLNYRVKLGEEYSDTLFTNLVNDSSDRTIFKTFRDRPFTQSGVISEGIASDMPLIVNNNRDQKWHLIPVYSSVSGIADLTLTYKDGSGNTVGSDSLSFSGLVPGTIRQFNIGTLAFTKPSTAEYSLLSGAILIDTIRINYLCESKYTAYTLAWLNNYGAYESQSFGLVSKKSIEVEKKIFSRLPYNIDDAGEIFYDSNDVYLGSKRAFSSVFKTKMSFTSHLLSDDEYRWLANLFKSADIYLYGQSGTKWMPVTITETSYDYRTYKNSKLVPLQFSVEFSDSSNAQFL